MPTTITYGSNSICHLDDVEASHLRPQQAGAIPLAEIADLVQAQLADPLDFPPLAQATIPGDIVTVAVEPGIPQLAHVIDGVLRALELTGADLSNITVLLTEPEHRIETLRSELASLGHSNCSLERHDPNDEKQMAFLGVSGSDLPIRLNRLICDADFVLPIGVSNNDPTTSTLQTYKSCLFPSFSDIETIERLAATTAGQFPGIGDDAAQEIDDCYKQLGAQLTVRVTPESNGQISSVVAGEFSAAIRAASDQYSSTWQRTPTGIAKLVIATIGGEDHQSWESVARAISSAESILEPEGAIVVCSELAEPPGRALGQLAGNEDPLLVEREILRTPSTDCGPAMVLCRVLQQHSVYLSSKLKASLVESLGITPLEYDHEIERLAQSLRPCAILEDAQWLQTSATAQVEGDHE